MSRPFTRRAALIQEGEVIRTAEIETGTRVSPNDTFLHFQPSVRLDGIVVVEAEPTCQWIRWNSHGDTGIADFDAAVTYIALTGVPTHA